MADEKKLTQKQKVFCEEYIIDWNASRAARKAGYSEKTAQQMGFENLSKPLIQAYIKEIQEDLQKQAGISKLRNLLELKKIAYSNMSDFKDGWMTVKDFERIDEDTKAALSEIQYTTRVNQHGTEEIVKFKVHDKLKAIDSINKMLGYNEPDQVESKIEVKGIAPINWLPNKEE